MLEIYCRFLLYVGCLHWQHFKQLIFVSIGRMSGKLTIKDYLCHTGNVQYFAKIYDFFWLFIYN